MILIDTHVHVDKLEDIPGAMVRAAAAGVTDIVTLGVDLVSMQRSLQIADGTSVLKVHAALGIHPGMVKSEDHLAALDFLKANIDKAVAVGETGLDYWYKWVRGDQIERGFQKDSFIVHLDLAKAKDKPIVIHSRGAWRDCLAMTQAAGVKKALFHWYSGPVDILEQIIAAGFYVSTSPSVGYSPESRTAMAAAPLERILIETDAPVRYKDEEDYYLSEPKDVARTLSALAVLKNMDQEQVLAQVNHNAREFFRI